MSYDVKLHKMTITAFEDIKFEKQCGQCSVQINPNEFTRVLKANWGNNKAMQSKNGSGQFSSFSAETYSFNIYFDGTGVVDDSEKSVKSRVDEFLAVTYKKSDESSKKSIPVYFKLKWCGEEFKCVTDSITVKYTLFNVSGAPLRANLTCSFSSVEEPVEEPKETPATTTTPKKNECPRPTKEEACCMCKDNYLSSMLKIMESWSKGSLIPKKD